MTAQQQQSVTDAQSRFMAASQANLDAQQASAAAGRVAAQDLVDLQRLKNANTKAESDAVHHYYDDVAKQQEAIQVAQHAQELQSQAYLDFQSAILASQQTGAVEFVGNTTPPITR